MADAYITGMAAASQPTGDELLELSQLSTTVKITATTISAQASDNSFNDSGNGFVTAGFAVGDRVRVQGFTGNAANNILVGKITARTAGKLTIGGTDGDVIVDDAAGESVTITKWVTVRATLNEVGASSYALTASEALSAGNFGNIHASSGAKVRKANATDDTKPCDCYIPAAISNGATGSVIAPGCIISGLSGLTPGSRYYLSTTGGGITDTAPSGSGNLVQEVGVAVSATQLFFSPKTGITAP